VYDSHLLIIKDVEPVGVLYNPNLVYKIKSVCILSDGEPDCVVLPCKKHSNKPSNSVAAPGSGKARIFENSLFANKTISKSWDVMKSAGLLFGDNF
jgi:phosphatidylinositol 4-phosphatase